MQENLHRFFRAARGAGVHVSPAESIDAMRAVASIGFSDRTVLRDSLLLTLAKSEDEKKALGACFDLFFPPCPPGGAPHRGRNPQESRPRPALGPAQSRRADRRTSRSRARPPRP